MKTDSHCPDKVDDIQALRKSSADQCNSSGQLLFSVDQKIPFQEIQTLIYQLFFENRDLERHSRSGEKLI